MARAEDCSSELALFILPAALMAFRAYCARIHNIEQQLLSMFGDTDGKRDAMLRFTKPATGGYYFASVTGSFPRRCNLRLTLPSSTSGEADNFLPSLTTTSGLTPCSP